ncbi:hypothetical protein F443_12501 [Phytophthora nicotianae P1569]|uniref:Uncharacterized protein n=1 Tax=Phytophthora nicotianae P1569 TaxID=1317065 RepID=V9EV67_PHYNI|nr:hypothetical protein F443_12501 [Phytophthora nicotianae P1569]
MLGFDASVSDPPLSTTTGAMTPRGTSSSTNASRQGKSHKARQLMPTIVVSRRRLTSPPSKRPACDAFAAGQPYVVSKRNRATKRVDTLQKAIKEVPWTFFKEVSWAMDAELLDRTMLCTQCSETTKLHIGGEGHIVETSLQKKFKGSRGKHYKVLGLVGCVILTTKQ